MSDDTMILNIQVPTRKPVPVNQSSKTDEYRNKRFSKGGFSKNRETERSDWKQKKQFGRESRFEERRNNRSDNKLMPDSRKIKKHLKGKRQADPAPFDPNATLEEILNVDEKKNEESDVFVGNNFEEIEGLNPKLLTALKENKYITLTRIQKESIPTVIKNRNCTIKSETGSGKTLAYLVRLYSQSN